MKHYLWKPVATLFLIFTFACGSKPVHQYEMFGYNDGKKQMKYTVTAWPAKLDGGAPGYRIETHINYSVGIKERRETKKTVLVNDAMVFQNSEAMRSHQGNEQLSNVVRKDDEVVVTGGAGGETDNKTRVPVYGDIFEIHPLLYAVDLTKPGAQKRYPIFHETSKSIKMITVQFFGDTAIELQGKKIPCKHFKIEEANKPGTFSDFYLDTENRPIYIKMGGFELIKAT